MSAIQIILTIVVSICLIVTAVIIIGSRNSSKKHKIRPNCPYIKINSNEILSQTNGHDRGRVTDQKKVKNKFGTFRKIWFFPTDRIEDENAPQPEVQKFVVNENFVTSTVEGEGGTHIQEITIDIKDPYDLTEKIRNTNYGKMLIERWKNQFFENADSKIVNNAINSYDEYNKKMNMNNMREKSEQEKDKELIDKIKSILIEKGTEKKEDNDSKAF